MPSQLQRQPISFVPETSAFWKIRYRTISASFIKVHDNWVPGWFTNDDGLVLLGFSEVIPNGTIVETGSFCGRSSRYLMLGAVLSGSTLYCVDIFTGELPGEDEEGSNWVYRDLLAGDPYPVFLVMMNQCFVSTDIDNNLRVLRSDSIEQAKKWSYGLIDMIFIDDDHTKCRQVTEAWMPHLAEHGAIFFHDVHSGRPYGNDGPINTVTQLLTEGWYLIYGESHSLLKGITRNPEWWRTRGESVSDLYRVGSGLQPDQSGLSEGTSTNGVGSDPQIH